MTHLHKIRLLKDNEVPEIKEKDLKPTCKICGSTVDVMLNGFCLECEDALEAEAK
jgi:hypothetical protein